MTELPEVLFSNPVWHALIGPHRHLRLALGAACRYPADVAPFAAIAAPAEPAFDALRDLLAPDESVWIADYGRSAAGIKVLDALACVQMVLPADAEPCAQSREVVPLTAANAQEMVALTDVAFPGFFRAKTYRMGYYCGIRIDGRLVAMAGERLCLDGYPELSGICTHPAHRGQGLASAAIAHLVARHRRAGLRSWLHVGAPNTRAIDLYSSLGFQRVRTVMLHRIVRSA
ncbi:MAG: GNAT family N-acetyltransferase [Steroidobacteraceae bacterium]|jgi:ribosomal protein S18 acetylase RimI-like enzyme